ncbi:MAG: transposase, partial [Candidatus Zixiibacteriota bacterium]
MKGNENAQEDFFNLWVYGKHLPKDHPLLQIKKEVDFSFVDEETKDLYSDHMGRPAYPAGVLFRMLFLEFFDNLSDVEVASQVQYNLVYRAFVGLGMDDPTPDDTTLVVFRQRLGQDRFERLFDRVVEQCEKLGLLRKRLKIVDATAVVADVAIPNTVNLLRQGRRVILREIAKRDKKTVRRLIKRYSTKERLSQKPKAEELVHEVELSRDFIQELKGHYAQTGKCLLGEGIEEKIDLLEKVIDPQKGEAKPVSFIDLDARHGRKSPKRMFSGYKAHIVEDESEIITSVEVLQGNQNEGSELASLLEKEEKKNLEAEAVVADALYDSADNRSLIHQKKMRAYIPLRHARKHQDNFRYIKGRDQLKCPLGEFSIGKIRQEEGYLYYFSEIDCRGCSKKDLCIGDSSPRARVWLSDDYFLKVMDDGVKRKGDGPETVPLEL